MFNYNPMSKDEAEKERFSLIDDGDYPAFIKSATAKISSSNNPMIEVDLDVFDIQGKPHSIRDYWVFSPKMMWKVIHGTESCGLLKEYEEKKFHPSMLPGKNTRVRIKTQKGAPIPSDKLKGKPEGSVYPDKNVVEDYLLSDPNSVEVLSPQNSFDTQSDIPF